MQHYSIGEWVDFARGFLPEKDSVAMRCHLGKGCAACLPLATFWRRLQGICAPKAPAIVPEEALRCAKAIFQAAAPAGRPRAVRLRAVLVYDSMLGGAQAGSRSAAPLGRQLMFHAADCCLDIVVEPDKSRRWVVTGQVLDRNAPDRPMSNLRVALKSGRVVLSETRTNVRGEFTSSPSSAVAPSGAEVCIWLSDTAKCVVLNFAPEDEQGSTNRLLAGNEPEGKVLIS
jgi:hypothetical protein